MTVRHDIHPEGQGQEGMAQPAMENTTFFPILSSTCIMSEEDQDQLPLDGLDAMPLMPRCDVTPHNSDLHLVVCTPPGEEAPVARILSTQARHLYRDTTTLSIPLWILNLESLRRLEEQNKIPSPSAAAEKIRAWLRHDRKAAWKELMEADQIHQGQLDLDDGLSLKLEG